MSEPYSLRRFRPEDLDAVADLAVWASSSPETACGQPDVGSVDEFKADYEHRNMEAEIWVAEAPEAGVIGFAGGSFRNGNYAVEGPIVRPEYQRQGLGSRLFRRLEEDASRLGAERLEAGVRLSNERGHAFLQSQGYEPARQIYVYESYAPLEATFSLPEGYTIGELKPRYLLPFLMVMHECFPGYRLPSTPQRLFEPDKMKIFLALDAQDKPVGAVTAFFYPEDRMAYIYHLAVSEPHRQHGLARGLLLSACDWLWSEHNPRFVGLSTSNERGVRQSLYEKVGFKLQYALAYLRKLLEQPAAT
jgi:GNAT superfamily N-acetyltransferase